MKDAGAFERQNLRSWETGNAFICELLMQHLLANIRMILALTPDTEDLGTVQTSDKFNDTRV